MYTIREVFEDMIKIAEATSSMNVKYFPRKGKYQIKYKVNGRYTTGWECLHQLMFLYETACSQKINWDYVLYTVYGKHIELSSSYKII